MAHRTMPRKEGRKRVRITTMIRCAAILLLVACTACRKELYYHDDDHALTVKVYAVTSWKQEWERTHSYNWKESWLDEFRYTYDALRPDKATGIKATVYGDDGYSGELHLPAEGESCRCVKENMLSCCITTIRNTSYSTGCRPLPRQRLRHVHSLVPA